MRLFLWMCHPHFLVDELHNTVFLCSFPILHCWNCISNLWNELVNACCGHVVVDDLVNRIVLWYCHAEGLSYIWSCSLFLHADGLCYQPSFLSNVIAVHQYHRCCHKRGNNFQMILWGMKNSPLSINIWDIRQKWYHCFPFILVPSTIIWARCPPASMVFAQIGTVEYAISLWTGLQCRPFMNK